MNYVTAAGVQQFSITIASGSTTGSVALGTAVGAGAYITYGGINPSVTTNFAEAGAYLSWATAAGVTTITATRNTGTAGTVVINGSMTDGDLTNLIASVQQGTVSISASTSGTASVTAPGSDSNTALHYMGNSGTGTALSAAVDFTRLTQSGTTVTATATASGTTVTAFCLIEYQSSCLTANAVQRISASSSSSVTSYTASLGANVVLANTISLYGGATIATVTTNLATGLQRGSLTGVGTFTVNINTGAANAKVYNASIVELNSGVLNSSVQRGTTTLTGVVSNTTTLTAINETYSGISWLGNTATATTAVLNQAEGAVALGTATSGGAAHIQDNGIFAAATSASVTITSSAAGNLLAASIDLANFSSGTPPHVSSVTDNKGQTWVQVPSAEATVTSANSDIWYFPNTASGVTSVTINGDVNTSAIMAVVFEVSGVVTSSPIEAHASLSNGAATTSPVTGAITTTTAKDFILTVFSNANLSTASSVASPYTLDNAEGSSAYHIPASTVSGETATFTVGSSSTYCASSAAFQASTTTSDVVIGTKTTATANITLSWEVFEYAAPSAGNDNTVTETVTESDSSTIIATDVASFTETQTETDIYTSAYRWTNTLSETQSESDSVIIAATDSGLDSESNAASDAISGAATGITNLNETGTVSDTHQGIASGLGLFTESNSVSDSYISSQSQGGANTLTETVTAADSYTVNATDSASITESQIQTDIILGAATGITNLNETGLVSDTHQGIASGVGVFTESETETDSYISSQTQPGQNTVTETMTESDSLTITATDSDVILELVAANDNYDCQQTVFGAPSTQQTGPGDDNRRRKYLDWLRRQKKKRKPTKLEKNQNRYAEKVIPISKPENPKEIKPDYRPSEQAARVAAIQTIITLLPMQLSPIVNEAPYYELLELINELREEEDEEAFMMLM